MIDLDVLGLSVLLDVPPEKLYMLSNDRSVRNEERDDRYSNYHTVVIHRGRGRKNRVLSVPNDFLKAVQRRILDRCLYKLPVSRFSTAYRRGFSLLDNAGPHVGKECIVKLDISGFFDSIDDDMVYAVMRRFRLSVPATVLLTHLCVHNSALPQGAPTSPYIANLVMKHFDESLGKWCTENGITYTRYCDDMTFSGSREAIRTSQLIPKVRKMLTHQGFKLNNKKTVVVTASGQQRVTGIVVNEKPQIPRELRRSIRQEVYYCTKFGVRESLERRGSGMQPEQYLRSLLGRINFALQTDPRNEEMKGYQDTVKELIKDIKDA